MLLALQLKARGKRFRYLSIYKLNHMSDASLGYRHKTDPEGVFLLCTEN
jgi:hypothetical protein